MKPCPCTPESRLSIFWSTYKRRVSWQNVRFAHAHVYSSHIYSKYNSWVITTQYMRNEYTICVYANRTSHLATRRSYYVLECFILLTLAQVHITYISIVHDPYTYQPVNRSMIWFKDFSILINIFIFYLCWIPW